MELSTFEWGECAEGGGAYCSWLGGGGELRMRKEGLAQKLRFRNILSDLLDKKHTIQKRGAGRVR